MKKLLTSILFIFFFTSHAQENIVKAGISFSNIGVMYERSVSNNFSVAAQIGAGFIARTQGDDTSIETGTGVLIEGRYYFSDKKGKMQGWHIGPAFELVSGKFEISPGAEKRFNFAMYTVNGGRQWIFKNKLTFGFHAGVGFQQVYSKQKNETPIAIQLGIGAGYAF